MEDVHDVRVEEADEALPIPAIQGLAYTHGCTPCGIARLLRDELGVTGLERAVRDVQVVGVESRVRNDQPVSTALDEREAHDLEGPAWPSENRTRTRECEALAAWPAACVRA